MAVWNDLPTEIITTILYHLDFQHESAVAMAVCYRFRAILEPKLYSEPIILWSDIPRCCIESGRRGLEHGSLRYFLHTILTRPELGSRVRSLILYASSQAQRKQLAQATLRCGCAGQAHRQANTSQPLSDEIINPTDVISAAAAQRGLLNSVVENRASGLVVLLLHHLPRLSMLDLSWWDNDQLGIVASAAMGHLEGGIPAGLRSLRSLELVYFEEANGYGVSICNVACFMTLPTLRDLVVGEFGECDGDYEHDDDDDDDAFSTSEVSDRTPQTGTGLPNSDILVLQWINQWIPPRSLPITRLKLGMNSVHCNTINLLLRLPFRLESFECVGFGGNIPDLPDFHASLLLPGLRMHASSLTELLITNINYDPDPSTLGSLDAFTALRHLRLPIELLMKSRSGDEFDGDQTVTPKEDIALRNPLDMLLPPTLVILELELNPDVTLKAFITATGIPATLSRTSQYLPSLRKFLVVLSRCTRHRARQDDVDLENAEQAAGLCRPPSQSDLYCGHEIELNIKGLQA